MKPLTFAALAALLAARPALAQTELSNFSATGRGGVVNTFAVDYQALGVNPANLGRSTNSRVAFTVGEAGAAAASRSLGSGTFRKFVFHPNDPLTAAQRTELVGSLTSDNTLNLNLDANAAAVSVRLPAALGGLAVSYRQRLVGHLALNRNAADIIVNGQDAAIVRQYYPVGSGGGSTNLVAPLLSVALAGTTMQLAWTAEYNVGYGVRVVNIPGVFALSAGVGYRYIQGLGVADVRAENGALTAYSALSPAFGIDYGSLSGSAGFNHVSGSGLRAVGYGHGFDLGLAAEVGEVLRLGAAVTDLGTMTWTGNVLTARDQQLQYPDYAGLSTYDVIQRVVNQFGDADKALLTYQADQQRHVQLPTKLRLGGGLRISKRLEAGLDVTVPLTSTPGNLPGTFVGAGLDYKPRRWLRLSSGVSGGGGYGAGLPLGITFVTQVWEAGFSTRNVLGYFSDGNPYYSAAAGVLRFRIGGK